MWRDKLTVGNEAIDDDHKYLICLLNAVEIGVKTGSGSETLSAFLTQLESYTVDHFKREELLLIEAGYPRYMQHKQEHQKLIGELTQLKNEFAAADELDQRDMAQKIFLFLKDWLIGHIVASDMDYAKFIAERRKRG